MQSYVKLALQVYNLWVQEISISVKRRVQNGKNGLKIRLT
jgi:hypothetical protein